MRTIGIEIVNRHCAYVRGRGSYAALIEVTGNKPVRSNLANAWVVSERTARHKLLPWLEHNGFAVTITGGEE